MLLAQLVENVGGIKAGVLAQLARDDLKCLCEGSDDQLLLASNGASICAEVLAQLHLTCWIKFDSNS